MSPPCKRCASTRMLNLDTAQRVSVVGSTLIGGAIGAWRTTALMEAGIFSTETMTEDADMTMAMLRSGYQVVYEDRAVATTEAPMSLKALTRRQLLTRGAAAGASFVMSSCSCCGCT